MYISIMLTSDTEVLVELGRRLRALRKARRLTLAEVAERAALDRTTVGRAERGDNPTLLTLVRLLRVYGRVGALEDFLREPEISPMQILRESRSRRGRR